MAQPLTPAAFPLLPFSTGPVPVLESPSSTEFLDEYRPVLIKGWLDGWPLYRALGECPDERQRLALLEDLAGSRSIAYSTLPADGRLSYRSGTLEPTFIFDEVNSTFAGFLGAVDEVLQGGGKPGLYLQSTPIATCLPELLPRLGKLPFRRQQVEPSRLWIGSGSQVVQLHYDMSSNYLCLLAGRKRVTLFPPEALPCLYPAPPDRGLAGTPCSLVELLAPDLETFPRLVEALPLALSVIVEPGDVLHIPPYWWHHVESAELNVMVNFWQADLSPRLRRVLSRCLEDLLLAEQDLDTDSRDRFHRWLGVALGELGSKGNPSPAPAEVPGELRLRLMQFLDMLALCPPYWRRLYMGLGEHYTRNDPFPSLPGEDLALPRRIGARRATGDENTCF